MEINQAIHSSGNLHIQGTQIYISQKRKSPPTDSSSLEAEIDRLVYELYGLIEEEIGIVENS